MKKYLLVTVIITLALASCEKKNSNPDNEINDFNYRSDFTYAHIMDNHHSGNSSNWVKLDNHKITIVLDLINSTGDYADFEYSVIINYADLESGIIMGTILDSINNDTGEFRFEYEISFEFLANTSSGEVSNFYMYND